MLKSIRVGSEFFHDLIENNDYYVDKTLFIKTVFKDYSSDVMLITRPRRFGKTLTMSMFYDFLSLDPENPGDISRQERLFKDTKICREEKKFCDEFMGKFPVIFLTLKSIAHENFQDSYNQFAHVISTLAGKFKYLESSPNLDDDEKQKYRDLKNYELLREQSDKTRLVNSLSILTFLLYRHHKIKPVLLIDEYDVPIAKAAYNGYYREMLDVIAPFLCNVLKTNENLGRAVLTGCLRAARESIFTGLNNLRICSVTDCLDDKLSRGIGFAKEETEQVLSYYGLSDYCDEVKRNYDGYYFGMVNMYCPWDIMSFCDANYRKLPDNRALITADNYWINTSGNDVIENFMEYIEPEDLDLMQTLLDGGTITTEVRDELCYGDLEDHDITDFWTLLLYTGYLTCDPHSRSSDSNEYRLYIPNDEIRKCFKSRILDFYKKNRDVRNNTADLIKALFCGDGETVEESLNRLLEKYVSVRDFATNAPKENYYHGFMNGLLVSGTSLIQEHKSNFESGNGYIDLQGLRMNIKQSMCSNGNHAIV